MSLYQISEPGESPVKEACKGRAVGIDLGTTNSLVAAVRDGRPEVLRDADGRALLPSVMHYPETAGAIVGREAVAFAAEQPKDTIVSVKRFMGRGVRDAEATRKRLKIRVLGESHAVLPMLAGGGGILDVAAGPGGLLVVHYMGGDTYVAEVVRYLVSNGVGIVSIEPERNELERIFLEVTKGELS